MQTENLITKKIWDFEPHVDTLYIPVKIKSTGNNHFKLCRFLRMVGDRVHGIVTGPLDKGVSWDGVKEGHEIYADFKKCCLYGTGTGESYAQYHYFNVLGYAAKELDLEEVTNIKTHPSFGIVGLSRRSSSGAVALFGSNLQHSQTIVLTIKRAENNRDLNRDWIHGQEQLIEIELSGAQFAELITSFNMGDGVACTIRNFNGATCPTPPYVNPVDMFQKEFAAKMKNLGLKSTDTIGDCITMLKEKQNITKADRAFISETINRFLQEIVSNIPFVASQFAEAMNKTVSHAKQEVETFITGRLLSMGVEAAQINPAAFIAIDDAKKDETDAG